MIGVHSVFNNPRRGFVYNLGHTLSLSELYTWVYSILTWKRDGHPIYLYCDKKIEEFVTKYGFDHLYDEIRVREYDDDIHECFWSYNKIRVLEEIHEPVCIFDIDTFFRDTEFTKLHYDMICYHYEIYGDNREHFNGMIRPKDEIKNLSFYEDIDGDFNVVNACMVVFNSWELKNEFLKNAKETVETIKDITYSSGYEYDSYTIFMEQVNLGYLDRKYDCTSLTKLNGDESLWGYYAFNSKEPVGHLGKQKHDLNMGNPITKTFFEHIMKEKIIELGFPKHSKLFNITMNEDKTDNNSLIPQRDKPFNRMPMDTVTNEVYTKWFENNCELLFDKRFSVALWGSIGGRDIDLIVSKKGKTTIKELEEYMSNLIYSGNEFNITVEALYTSDMDYFREFRMENSHKVLDDVLIGFISEHPYNPIGKVRRYNKMVFHYGPFNDAYYLCTTKDDEVLFIDSVKDLKDNKGYTHFSSEVYNTIYERFGIFSLID